MTSTQNTVSSVDTISSPEYAELLRMRAENEELKRKAAAKEAAKLARQAKIVDTENALPVLVDYNAEVACTFEDIAMMMQKSAIIEDAEDIQEARNFVKLFGLAVQAILKNPAGVRGAGRHVFLRKDVERCILLVRSVRV